MTLRYLSPVLPNQPDSGDRGHGRKMRPECRQCDCTCAMIATAFAASVDVTGAANGWRESRSGRSCRNRIQHPVAVFWLSDRRFDRWYKSDSGHAHLSELGWRRWGRGRNHFGRFLNGRLSSFRLRNLTMGRAAACHVSVA